MASSLKIQDPVPSLRYLNSRKGVKMNFEKLQTDLMIRLSDEELETIKQKSENFKYHLTLLHKIDVTGVEPMTYPNEALRTSLREDEVSHVISQEVAFKNAPKTNSDYFEIVQVIEK